MTKCPGCQREKGFITMKCSRCFTIYCNRCIQLEMHRCQSLNSKESIKLPEALKPQKVVRI